MENPLQPLVDRWFGKQSYFREPWRYQQSPYAAPQNAPAQLPRHFALGDLVPGNMPTRWGPLMPIPDAALLLAQHGITPAPAEFWPSSPLQERDRIFANRPAAQQPLAANLTAPVALLEVNGRESATIPVPAVALLRPQPTILHPRPYRPAALTTADPEAGTGCGWIQDHPVMALGLIGLTYLALRSTRK